MAEAAAVLDAKAFLRAAKQAPRRLRKNIKETLPKIFRSFERRVIMERFRGPPGLKTRSGALQQSIDFKITGFRTKKLGLAISIGGRAAPYAQIQEKGGTVKGKGKKLAIPIGEGKTRAGVSRVKSPRDIAGLVLIPRKGKAPLLVLPTGRRERGFGAQRTAKVEGVGTLRAEKGETFIPMFVLIAMVRLVPRLGFVATWTAQRMRNVKFLNAAFRGATRQAGIGKPTSG